MLTSLMQRKDPAGSYVASGVLAFWLVLVPSLALSQTGSVSGRVLSYPEGEGMADVSILVMDGKGQAASAISLEDGSYQVDGIDPGYQRVRARPPAEINAIGAYWPESYFFCAGERIHLGGGEERDGVDFFLPGGGFLTGQVVDHSGLPIAGAVVTATGVDLFNQHLIRSGETNALGRYDLFGLDSFVDLEGQPIPGTYRLSLRQSQGPGLWFPGVFREEEGQWVEASRGSETVADWQLPAPAELRARIQDEDGSGIPNAELRVQWPSGGLWTGQPSEDGSIVLELPGDPARLEVHAAGYGSVLWDGGEDGEAPGGLVPLEPGGSVEIQPIVLLPGASLTLSLVLPAGGSGEDLRQARISLIDSETGDEESFAFLPSEGPLEVAFEDLREGSWDLLLRPPAHALWLEQAQPGFWQSVAGRADVRSLSVARAGGLVGVVGARGEGRPLRGAVAELFSVDGEDVSPVASAQSDGEGRYVFGRLPAGDYHLKLRWSPFCPGDPAWVERWWPDARQRQGAGAISIRRGEVVELEETLLAPDHDGDGIDDVWELLWGLNLGRNDRDGDPDGDGISNLQEYRASTDPLRPGVQDGQVASCTGSIRGNGPLKAPQSTVGHALVGLLGLALARRRRGGTMRRIFGPRE